MDTGRTWDGHGMDMGWTRINVRWTQVKVGQTRDGHALTWDGHGMDTGRAQDGHGVDTDQCETDTG